MASKESLKSLPSGALWEYLKWLAFGQGRYVGICTSPGKDWGDSDTRIRRLTEDIACAAKHPDDAELLVAPPAIAPDIDDATLVHVIENYVAARQVALYREAEDFESCHASEIQDEALVRILAKWNLRHL